jgi:hypothetical protein
MEPRRISFATILYALRGILHSLVSAGGRYPAERRDTRALLQRPVDRRSADVLWQILRSFVDA